MSRKSCSQLRDFYRNTYRYRGEELEYWVKKACAEPRNDVEYTPPLEMITDQAEIARLWETGELD